MPDASGEPGVPDRWSRRRFLGLLSLLLSGGAAACASPSPPAAPAAAPAPAPAAPTAAPAAAAPARPTSAPAPAAAPRSGSASVLRVPLASDTPTFEVGLLNQLIPNRIGQQLHAGLFRLDSDGQHAPYIAKSWEISPDATRFTIHLRDDAKFHHGRRVVAMDFKETWTRHLTPSLKAQFADNLKAIAGGQDVLDGKTDQLSGVEVPNETTLIVTLKEPDPEFLNYLGYGVLAKETVVAGKPEWVDKPVGAGPFKFADWQRNSKIVLDANPDFFLGRPKVDRLDLLIVPDSATARAQYEAGELDVITLAATDVGSVRSDPVLSKQLVPRPSLQLVYFGFNQQVFPPFKNAKLRQAFCHAVDTTALVEQVLQGSAERSVGLVPRGIYSFNDQVRGYSYDPAKAKQLLAEAGYPEGRGLPELTLQTGQEYSTVAEASVAQLTANLGIPLKLEVTERAEFVRRNFTRTTLQFYLWGWTGAANTPTTWLYQLLHSKSPTNFVNWENLAYDRIVDEARVTADDAKRTALYRQAEQQALDEAVLGPIYVPLNNYLIKPYVTGLDINVTGPAAYYTVELKR